MDPTQALQLLDNICSQVNLTRQQHAAVMQARQVLADALSRAPVCET